VLFKLKRRTCDKEMFLLLHSQRCSNSNKQTSWGITVLARMHEINVVKTLWLEMHLRSELENSIALDDQEEEISKFISINFILLCVSCCGFDNVNKTEGKSFIINITCIKNLYCCWLLLLPLLLLLLYEVH